MRILKQFFVVLFFTFGLISPVFSSFSPQQVQKGLDIALAEVRTHYKPVTIFESDYLLFGDSMVINPVGTHYIFLYKKGGDYVTRIDNSDFHGQNFERSLFKFQNNIYAFGGYGFWHSHSKLIRYNWSDQEWDLVRLNGELPDVSPILSIKQGDSIYALYQFHPNNHKQNLFDSIDFYVIDLNTLAVSRKEYTRKNELIINVHQYQEIGREKWSVWGKEHAISQIYNHETKELFVNFSGPWPFRGKLGAGRHLDSNWLLNKNDFLYVISHGKTLDSIHIPQYVKLYCKKIADFQELKPLIEEEPKLIREKVYRNWILALVISLALIISVIIVLILTKNISIGEGKRKIKEYYSELNSDGFNFDSLFQLYFGIYSEKELDIALRIYHLPKDVRVLKRSQMLFAINQMKPGFIERKIHPKHPNQFIYEIKNY